jgi:hypothetical protein
LRDFALAGVLTEELSRTPATGLRALGIHPLLEAASRAFKGPSLQLSVDGDQPWLVALAEELSRVWTSPRARVEAAPGTSSQLRSDRASGRFDAQLLFLRRDDPLSLHSSLYDLDKTPAPKQLQRVSLSWTARRLRLGVVGALHGSGSLSPDLRGLSSEGAFALQNTFFVPRLD